MIWQIKDWWRIRREKLMFGLVWLLPAWVIRLATIRCFAHATTTAHTDLTPDQINVWQALKAWEVQ